MENIQLVSAYLQIYQNSIYCVFIFQTHLHQFIIHFMNQFPEQIITVMIQLLLLCILHQKGFVFILFSFFDFFNLQGQIWKNIVFVYKRLLLHYLHLMKSVPVLSIKIISEKILSFKCMNLLHQFCGYFTVQIQQRLWNEQ